VGDLYFTISQILSFGGPIASSLHWWRWNLE